MRCRNRQEHDAPTQRSRLRHSQEDLKHRVGKGCDETEKNDPDGTRTTPNNSRQTATTTHQRAPQRAVCPSSRAESADFAARIVAGFLDHAAEMLRSGRGRASERVGWLVVELLKEIAPVAEPRAGAAGAGDPPAPSASAGGGEAERAEAEKRFR
jgi:hypothetical protein